MSLHEYEASRSVAIASVPFYALIMGAMRRADTANARRLAEAFPMQWQELNARYNAAGGILPTDAEGRAQSYQQDAP